MPRKPRALEPNRVYHVFNRRTEKQPLFPSPRAYDEFVLLIEEGRQRYDIRICGYCLMKTHWHQAIWVREGQGATMATTYLQWLSGTHAIRFRIKSGTRGQGHVYQDRYQSKAVSEETHYLTLIRYIEANPLSAGLVTRAEDWRWSSLQERISGNRRILHRGPVSFPDTWVDIVNSRPCVSNDEGTDVDLGTEVVRGTEVGSGTEVA
jgi:putative transposase